LAQGASFALSSFRSASLASSKMKTAFKLCILGFVHAAAINVRGNVNSLAPAPAPAAGPGPGPSPMPADNFHTEALDQANPEFHRVDADKNDCVSFDEIKAPLLKQLTEFDKMMVTAWQHEKVGEVKKKYVKDLFKSFNASDENQDSCLDFAEWKTSRVHQVPNCKASFFIMDANGDGKVSQSEAYEFASEHMHHADIKHNQMWDLFQDADLDANNFISEKEFCTAGANHQGDGKEAQYHKKEKKDDSGDVPKSDWKKLF